MLVLRRRPIMVAVAGPKGAGKTTFVNTYLSEAGLEFINADVLAHGLNIDSYAAAEVAERARSLKVRGRESFIFETVFSDPVGDKVDLLKRASDDGYTVVLCFVGVSDAATSANRVAQRVSNGGHDVPTDKLISRYPRTMENLRRALAELPYVFVFDHDDLREPHRPVAVAKNGKVTVLNPPVPAWLKKLLP